MAAMTTALTEYSDKENSRIFTYTGHTVTKPRKVLQKRKEPGVNQEIIEDTITVYYGDEDSAGDPIDSRVTFTLTLRRSKNGIAGSVTAALATLRDIVAGDEYGVTTVSSSYLS